MGRSISAGAGPDLSTSETFQGEPALHTKIDSFLRLHESVRSDMTSRAAHNSTHASKSRMEKMRQRRRGRIQAATALMRGLGRDPTNTREKLAKLVAFHAVLLIEMCRRYHGGPTRGLSLCVAHDTTFLLYDPYSPWDSDNQLAFGELGGVNMMSFVHDLRARQSREILDVFADAHRTLRNEVRVVHNTPGGLTRPDLGRYEIDAGGFLYSSEDELDPDA
jgi:hypothetical protein